MKKVFSVHGIVAVATLATLSSCLTAQSVLSEETVTSSSSSYYSSGVGFKGANKFAPKYKQRIKTYQEQIQMGLDKGWLTAEQAEHFRAELVELTEMDAQSEKANYAQPGVDELDKAFTKFNMAFSRAGSTPPAAATTPAGATPASTAAPAAPKPAPSSASGSPAPKKPAAPAKAPAKKPAAKPAKPAAKK